MVTVRYREANFDFASPVRVFISGCSGAGKTLFARDFIKQINVKRIYYFHPDLNETKPTDWEQYLEQPIVYNSEFPTVDDLSDYPEFSCLVFDDLINECVNNKAIDYLFRVLSRKLKYHVIIMSQNYFPHGRYTISIRNCSNYHVLMRNSDASMTRRIATSLGLKQEITKAIEYNCDKLYSYIFVDRTNQATVNKVEVYIDILSRIRIAVRKSMKYYLLAESDFKQCFEIKDCDLAEYADKKFKKEDNRENDRKSQASPESKFKKRRRERRFIRRQVKKALH